MGVDRAGGLGVATAAGRQVYRLTAAAAGYRPQMP